MTTMTSRHTLKLKALRAAAGVALFTGAVGCGTADTGTLDQATTIDDAGAVVAHDAGAPRDAGFRDAGFVDAGHPDAGFVSCDVDTMTPEDYIACCESIGWDWNRGCAAWGPPAPPAMEVA